MNHVPAFLPPSFADPSPILARLAALGAWPSGLASDSRALRPGELFVAWGGERTDGRKYIPDAIARGAAAILWQSGDDFVWNDAWRVPNLPADNPRQLAGPLAHHLFGQAGGRLPLIAVTGTNGKTSISQWIARTHPESCAVVGTLGTGFLGPPGQLVETGLTTPEAAALARYLAEFAAAGAKLCALEASSVGIAEGRLDGAPIEIAVFSNLTRDHLDYHGTMENYAAAKARLFAWPGLRLVVLNRDDPFGRALLADGAARCPDVKFVVYTQAANGAAADAEVRAEAVEDTPAGLRFRLAIGRREAPVETRLIGRYNVSNLLAVAAVLSAAGLSPGEIAARFAALSPPPGRMETLGGDAAPLVAVDYAHTPDALENVLRALRGIATRRQGRLIALFGCGGGRDHGKRPQMGEIAARLADHVVLSSDNPRDEEPLAILEEIRAGAPAAEIVADRRAAIRRTLQAAKAADVILLAGKGHENYQEVMGRKSPFSDLAEARLALAARQGNAR